MDELKPSEVNRLIESLQEEAMFQRNRVGRRVLADELTEAANALDVLGRRAQPDNPPLTLEQLRQMKGNWAWIEADIQNSFHYSGWGKIIQTMPLSAKIIINNPGYITQYDIHRYSAKFYAHKPEEDAN